jgi:hypothetical protein
MIRKIFLILCIFFISYSNSYASDFSAEAVTDTSEVYQGSSLILQIRVSGSNTPSVPDLSGLTDFTVKYVGGSENSSSSITIINGKMKKNESKGFIFTFSLTPKKIGTLLIPAIEVISGNEKTKTEPIVIVARKPAVETNDFKLELKLSKEQCYVGEPVTLTVTWYIGKNVRNFNFNLPILNDARFRFIDPEIDRNSGKKLYRIPLGGSEVIGEEGRGIAGTKYSRYTTISFKKILIPNESGTVPIEQATVTCSALSGYAKRSNDRVSSFFDDDFFRPSRREVYKTVLVPSNTLSLKVKDLPLKGKPANFRGHIGSYKISANASPLKVNVGDPITLTVSIKGGELIEYVEMPPLNEQVNLNNMFKIPQERASAETMGESKVFTQTIRPRSSDITEIPPVELPYFDVDKREYRVAKTEPIPLTVRQAKNVTLLDAEGTSDLSFKGNDIETWGKGIAFNYEDMSLLKNEYLTPLSCFKAGPWPYLILGPPFMFAILFTGASINRKRNGDPLRVLSRKAFGKLQKALKSAESAPPDRVCEMVLDIFREYLGVKLQLPSGGAITFSDAKQNLESLGIEQDIIDKLKGIFESCEAGRYAGNITFKNSSSLINDAASIAADLEKRLK